MNSRTREDGTYWDSIEGVIDSDKSSVEMEKEMWKKAD